MTARIYHNPRCSKSRAALELLRERCLEPEVIEYLQAPPSKAELEALLELLGAEPRALFRTKEPAYTAAGLDDPGLGRDALLAALAAEPALLERPIVVIGSRAVIARPPERLLELL